jgi:hypothetical protein
MQPIADLDREVLKNLEFILTDIDDTLTQNGKLGAEAYSALWELEQAGYAVIPVTGRPAGWCDLIVRQWPVAGVVGENGAFAFYLHEGGLKQLFHPSVDSGAGKSKFEQIKAAVFNAVPGTREAKDQFSRLFDLAIDFREEPPFLDFSAAMKIKEICESFGAEAKISSIHVNTWFGKYDKLDMITIFLREICRLDIGEDRTKAFFVGDSPNDEPMFRYFPLSAAPANIKDFSEMLQDSPAYVSSMGYGTGFAEIARTILLRGPKST